MLPDGVAESLSSLSSIFEEAHLRKALTLPGTRYHGTLTPYPADYLQRYDVVVGVLYVSEEDTFFERLPPLLSVSLHG